MNEVPVKDIEAMRYLDQDWNNLSIMLIRGRTVARFSNPRELEAVLNIVKWAISFHDRAVEVTKEIEEYNR